jgi:hypothetical protein
VLEKPAFIQGFFEYEGGGLEKPVSFPTAATYKVPSDKRAQTIYFRAGNPAAEMVYLVLTRGGKAMRYFPIGAKGSVHVPLAVLEDLSPGSVIELLVGAPLGLKSSLVLDVGFMEIT